MVRRHTSTRAWLLLAAFALLAVPVTSKVRAQVRGDNEQAFAAQAASVGVGVDRRFPGVAFVAWVVIGLLL